MKNFILLSLTLSTVVAQADGFMMNMVGRTVKNSENDQYHGVVEGGINVGGKVESFDDISSKEDKELGQLRQRATVVAIEASLKAAFQEDAEKDPSVQFAQFRLFEGKRTVVTDALGNKRTKVVLLPVGSQSPKKDRYGNRSGGSAYIPPNDFTYERKHGLKEQRAFTGWTIIVHTSDSADTATLPSDLAVGRANREKSEYSFGGGNVIRENDDGTVSEKLFLVRYKNQKVWCKGLTKQTSVCMNRDMAMNLGEILTLDGGVGANLVRQISEPGEKPMYFFMGPSADVSLSMPFQESEDTRGAYRGMFNFGIAGY